MIRYNKELVNYINKTVRNYNAKINRLSKTNPSLALPEKVSAKSIKNASENRTELIRNLNKLKRFSDRGAENTIILPSGEFISNYEINELKRESARLQRNLTRRINELSVIKPRIPGIKQDFTYAEMGDAKLNNLIVKRDTLAKMSKNLTKGTNLKNFIKLIETTRKRQSSQISEFKNNYIDKMLAWQGYAIGYDKERINEIKEKLNKLSDRDFLNFFDSEAISKKIAELYAVFNKMNGENYFTYEEQAYELFDELYNEIDDILSNYKSYKK